MAIFNYKAKDKAAHTIKGKVEAVNEQIAANILKEKNLYIIKISRRRYFYFFDKLFEKFFSRIKIKDEVVFFKQLSVLISANIPLVQALYILAKQTSKKNLRSIILDVADDVEGGNRLSESFAKYPYVFNSFIVSMIRSGETSGKLEEVLIYLANQQEQDYDMMSKIRGAMIYPAFVFFMLIVVGLVVMIFVIPKLTAIFVESDAKLPLATMVLINVSNFLVRFWWLVIFILLVISVFFQICIKIPAGRRQFDILKLKLPVLGLLLRRIYLVRFARSFATLLTGGVVLTRALEVSRDVVGNIIYKDLLTETIKEVEDGNPLATVFSKSPYVPLMFSQMVSVGEEAGQLDSVLVKITDFYTKEVESLVRNLLALLEPVIIIFMGIAVAILVSAVILPIYNLASQF